jgi:hypothetical protein
VAAVLRRGLHARPGYEGPGEGQGNRIVPRSFYGPGKGFDVRATAWELADRWMTFLQAKLPKAITFLYMPDEPSPPPVPAHPRAGRQHPLESRAGRALPVFVTHEYAAPLEGAIDIWCSGPRGFKLDESRANGCAGRQYWFYNGIRPVERRDDHRCARHRRP